MRDGICYFMSLSPDPNAPFAVPAGYRLLDSDSVLDNDLFDWDTIKNNPNLELWLIRTPNNLSAKHLESVALSPSPSLHPSKIGELTRKETTYDIWSQNPLQSNANGDEALQQPICGEEMRSITCLLPRRSKGGGLYAAPKPITRHVIITAKPSQPQPVTGPASSADTSVTNPLRQSYPPDLLKHRFMPYGSLAPIDDADQDHKQLETSKEKGKLSNRSVTWPSVVAVDIDTKPAPLSPAGKGAKETKKEQGKHSLDVDAPTLVDSAPHPVNLPAAEGGKPSNSKKRKGDKEVNEGVKKSKKPKTKDI